MIDEKLKRNIQFVRDIEALAKKMTIYDDKRRDMLFSAYHYIALTHFISINQLIENKLYTSAFALIRVLFEAVIRGKYLLLIMDGDIIKKIFEKQDINKFFKTPKEMCDKLDTVIGVDFFSELKKNTYSIMNDYTHSGKTSIARNFKDNYITHNYDEETIKQALHIAHTLMHTMSMAYFEEIGYKQKEITHDELEMFSKRKF